MGICAAVKPDGSRCKARAMQGSEWCFNHHPDRSEERRRNASKGGKRGGRGRPQVEVNNVKTQLQDLVDGVLDGRVERADAIAVGQLLNTFIRAVGVELKVREQEEITREVEALRVMVEMQRDRSA